MKYWLLVFLTMMACMIAANGRAQEPKPAWLSDEVVEAAVTIGLTQEQLEPFRATVFTFLEDYGAAVRRLIRRNEPQLELHIDRKCEALAREMDVGMAKFLSEEQLARYQNYRQALIKALDEI